MMRLLSKGSRLSWQKDGADWPNHKSSCFVEAGGLRWHLQRMGHGDTILLLHGTGASTHSWRDLMPVLARRFTVIAPDLPGHGFTDHAPSSKLSLTGMARAIAALIQELEIEPEIVVGHSAGAAILARLCIDGTIDPKLLVSINGALLPFEGVDRRLFPAVAKLLFANPITSRIFAWSADRAVVAKLIRDTGSTIDRHGVDLYARLLRDPTHVGSALGMMANWDLGQLNSDLRKLKTPVVLISAKGDLAVPYAATERIRSQIPNVHIETLHGLGHLAHEEQPKLVADLISRYAEKAGQRVSIGSSALN
jgi:magnesium chelatase accessory protein